MRGTMTSRLRLPDSLAFWILCVVLTLLFALRLPLIGDYAGFTADMGSYLVTRNWILGSDPNGYPNLHFRPPLVGLALIPFTWLFGDLSGSKLLAIMVSVLPAVPAFFLLRRLSSPRIALIGALALTAYPFWGKQAAGGYLSFLAMAPFIWGIDTFDRVQEHEAPLWRLAIPTFLVLGLNQTMGILYIASLVLSMWTRRGALALTVALVAGVVWLPFYLVNLPLAPLARIEGAPTFARLFNEASIVHMGAITFCAFLVGARRACTFLLPGLAMALGTNWASSHVYLAVLFSRCAFVLPLFTVAAICSIKSVLSRAQACLPTFSRATLAIGAGLICLASFMWFHEFHITASNIPIMNGYNEIALTWLRENTNEGDAVLAHPQGLAWYVGGLAHRKFWGTWQGKPEEWARPVHEAFLCTTGWAENCNPQSLNDEWAVHYIVLDRASPETIYGAPKLDEDTWCQLESVPWLERAFVSGPTVVYKVKAR